LGGDRLLRDGASVGEKRGRYQAKHNLTLVKLVLQSGDVDPDRSTKPGRS